MLAIVIAGFVRSPRSPQNKSVHYRHPQRHDCQSIRLYKYQTQLKSMFKMPSVCSNASWKTLTPLPDRFIDEHLVEIFPLSDQAWLQLVNVMNPAAIHTLLQLPAILVVYWVQVRTVGWPQSWSDEFWCLLFTLIVYKWQVTAVSNAVLETEIFCHRYLNIYNSAIK